MKLFSFTVSLLMALTPGDSYRSRPDPNVVAYNWKLLEFGFPSPQAKQQAIASGNFVPTNAVPIDVQPHYGRYGKRVFATIPKFGGGIPYTLAEVTREMGRNGPLLKAYPNYQMHDNKNGRNCDAITSVFRVTIDDCGWMWVIDSGTVGLDAQCDPQILAFDLDTDKLVYRHRFNKSVYTPGASLLINIALSVRNLPPVGYCGNIMVYMADVNYHGLVVHDVNRNESWRIEDRSMYPEPSHGLMTVAGQSFVLMDGMFALATDNENLYYHALASKTEYAVPLRVINNSTLVASNGADILEAFQRLGERNSVCAATVIDKEDNWYCVTLNPIQLLQWNVNTPFNSRTMKSLPINPKDLEFVSGIKVVENYYGRKELWMMSNRFQKIAAGTMNYNETNFRIVVHLLEE